MKSWRIAEVIDSFCWHVLSPIHDWLTRHILKPPWIHQETSLNSFLPSNQTQIIISLLFDAKKMNEICTNWSLFCCPLKATKSPAKKRRRCDLKFSYHQLEAIPPPPLYFYTTQKKRKKKEKYNEASMFK